MATALIHHVHAETHRLTLKMFAARLHIHPSIHPSIHTYIHPYMHTCIYTVHTCSHTCTRADTHTHTRTCCHTYRNSQLAAAWGPWSCMIFPGSGTDLQRSSPPFSGTERRVMCEAYSAIAWNLGAAQGFLWLSIQSGASRLQGWSRYVLCAVQGSILADALGAAKKLRQACAELQLRWPRVIP